MAAQMRRILAPNARVVLSGLLVSQANAALSVYRAHGLMLERCIVRDGWMTLVLRRGGRHGRRQTAAERLRRRQRPTIHADCLGRF
jgi:hypothetical protein